MSRTNSIISKFPHFYQSGDSENDFYQFIKVFGSILDEAEEDLIKVMRSHWVKYADNEGSKGFDAVEKGDLDKIFTLYLENLGGTVLLKQGKRRSGIEGKEDDQIYRNRILGIIDVLQNGASTKGGIIDIVAANLGVLPDLPFAEAAKNQIKIIEYNPQPSISESKEIKIYEAFEIENTSVASIIPEIRIKFKNDLPVPLINPRIVHLDTGNFVQFVGAVTAHDNLFLLSDGTGLFNGTSFPITGNGIVLPPGKSQLWLESAVGLPEGYFNLSKFDFSQFDSPNLRQFGTFGQTRFDQAVFRYENPIADLAFTFYQLTPATFKVNIPWDLPGFTVKIKITDQTLSRLSEFGIEQTIIDKISPLVNTEYETIEAFYDALKLEFGIARTIIDKIGPLASIEYETIAAFYDALKLKFGITQTIIDKISSLANTEYETIEAFYKALKDISLSELSEEELANLSQAILKECEFPDKFERFNINPRHQIKTIVDKVKAAGVYAEISYEKRFREDQNLGTNFILQNSWEENQEMEEDTFTIESRQSNLIEHEMDDNFIISGVFDFTNFDSLNRFA